MVLALNDIKQRCAHTLLFNWCRCSCTTVQFAMLCSNLVYPSYSTFHLFTFLVLKISPDRKHLANTSKLGSLITPYLDNKKFPKINNSMPMLNNRKSRVRDVGAGWAGQEIAHPLFAYCLLKRDICPPTFFPFGMVFCLAHPL